MLIKCQECGKEVSDKALTCPNCGCPIESNDEALNGIQSVNNGTFNLNAGNTTNDDKKKKNGCAGCLTCIIMIAFLIFLLDSCLSDGSTETPSTVTPTTQAETTEENKEKEVSKGNSFDVDGLVINIDDIVIDYTDYDDEYGFHKLEEDKQYVHVKFTCTNNSDSDKYVSIYDYECYADGSLCESYYGFNSDFMNANLSSGRNVTYSTYYIVPKEAKEIELEYTKNILTNEKIIIKIK